MSFFKFKNKKNEEEITQENLNDLIKEKKFLGALPKQEEKQNLEALNLKNLNYNPISKATQT